MTRYVIVYDGRQAPGSYEFKTIAIATAIAAGLDMSRVEIEPV